MLTTATKRCIPMNCNVVFKAEDLEIDIINSSVYCKDSESESWEDMTPVEALNRIRNYLDNITRMKLAA